MTPLYFWVMATVSFKCLNQIKNKWWEIGWHQRENHDILYNYPAASKRHTLAKWFPDSSSTRRSPTVDSQETQFTNVVSRGFIWHAQVSSHPSSIKGKTNKQTRTGVSVLIFCPGLSCAFSSCAPTLCLMSHLPALPRKARQASPAVEK